MTRALVLTWLGWACFAGGAGAMAVYVIHFAGRQGWRRPWNAAGLFFTAIALVQLPLFLHEGAQAQHFASGVLAVACLLAAVGLQSVTALRARRDGRKTRAGDSGEASA